MQEIQQITDDLLKLIRSGESETVEFKLSFGKEVIETAVSFANTKGGYIFIGLNDDGSAKGVSITEEQIKNWLNHIKMATLPQLFPQHHIYSMDSHY
jgi:ATP-dependent DNA helicase RecG